MISAASARRPAATARVHASPAGVAGPAGPAGAAGDGEPARGGVEAAHRLCGRRDQVGRQDPQRGAGGVARVGRVEGGRDDDLGDAVEAAEQQPGQRPARVGRVVGVQRVEQRPRAGRGGQTAGELGEQDVVEDAGVGQRPPVLGEQQGGGAGRVVGEHVGPAELRQRRGEVAALGEHLAQGTRQQLGGGVVESRSGHFASFGRPRT
ncbi:hypothetical protein [Frankia sp. ArI3]|uniref:hypothetical protein n=1 Tax=Frankia sp. ArI3 TaxID=1858 RepID=UPI0021057735|nr:hypothetical protein [Frankia sp. ArI3]